MKANLKVSSKIPLLLVLIIVISQSAADNLPFCDPKAKSTQQQNVLYNSSSEIQIGDLVYQQTTFLNNFDGPSNKLTFSYLISTKGNQLKIDVANQYLNTQSLSYAPTALTTTLEFIDAYKNMILVYEYDTQASTPLQYTLVSVVCTDQATCLLDTFMIDAKKDDSSPQNQDISPFIIDRIIEYDETSNILSVSLIRDDASFMILEIDVQNKGGVLKHLNQFDLTAGQTVVPCNKLVFYDETNHKLLIQTLNTQKTVTTTDIDTISQTPTYSTGQNIIIDLSGPNFYFLSLSIDKKSYSGFLGAGYTLSDMVKSTSFTSSEQLRVFTDNYMFLIVAALQDTLITMTYPNIKSSSVQPDSYLLSTLGQGPDCPKIIQNFYESLQVSSSSDQIYVLTQSTIYAYKTDPTFTQLTQMTYYSDLGESSGWGKRIDTKFTIACICLINKMVRFTCFSSTLNCQVTRDKRYLDCTTSVQ